MAAIPVITSCQTSKILILFPTAEYETSGEIITVISVLKIIRTVVTSNPISKSKRIIC